MTNQNPLAPIVLFVYNRPWHTQQTIEALQKNELADQSELFIFSDGAKNDLDRYLVNEVRAYIKTVNGFKEVVIVEKEKNWGLANSIIDGVTSVINRYGKIIVLEDDLITSCFYLKFMNDALTFYEREKKVWHISGWNYPIDTTELDTTFFWQVMNCSGGWATWQDRWSHFEKNPQRLLQNWSKAQIKDFDLDNSGIFWSQVVNNKKGIINTWAIFWYATIFEHDGLCLNPTQTLVNNIGHDGSGVHCGNNQSHYEGTINLTEKFNFNKNIVASELARKRIKKYYKAQKKSFATKVINKLYRTVTGANLIK